MTINLPCLKWFNLESFKLKPHVKNALKSLKKISYQRTDPHRDEFTSAEISGPKYAKIRSKRSLYQEASILFKIISDKYSSSCSIVDHTCRYN